MFGYTNHTLMPEALETWPIHFFEQLLPRHLEIIYRINEEFLLEVEKRFKGDGAAKTTLSIIGESHGRRVRMSHLAVIGSHKVNGVAKLHSDLMKKTIFSGFAQMFPDRFTNVTNGITVRRWLKQSNLRLARLLTERLGSAWENDLEEIERLRWAADDPGFRAQFREIKRANKIQLAEEIDRRTGIDVSVDSLFDVHVKRIHEYKRQLLNILYVITRYNRIKARPDEHWVPRTVMFAGKAAPGYAMAKGIIRLINNVSTTINQDPVTLTKLKCVFLPDYDVSLAQTIMPAADLSQQISTAGMEASGTGNMKLALNGALTIGTLDGANIEIRDSVGPENIFIFGMTADEAAARQANGYRPRDIVAADPELAATLEIDPLGCVQSRQVRRCAHGGRSPDLRWRAVPGARRFCRVLRSAGSGRCVVPATRGMEPPRGAQYRWHGAIFQRPQRARICGTHLEHPISDIEVQAPSRKGATYTQMQHRQRLLGRPFSGIGA